MKGKVSKKLLIILLVLAISIPMISYAINFPTEKEEELFMSSDKQEVAKGEKVVLTLNLNLIEYEDFEFTLTSNMNMNNVTTKENVEVTSDSNSFKFIANKSELDINQIDLYYQIPEEIETGTKIELTGIVKEYKSENIEDEGSNDKESTENTLEENKEQKVTIIITVVEKQEQSQNQNNDKNNNQNNMENQMSENETKKEQGIGDKTSSQETKTQQNVSTKTTSSVISGNQETNTYNGESNNYLSTLEITNFNINPEFTKTNTTYFIEVGSDVTQICIDAEAEDENATVNIYGNEDLQDGENKILISVKAENGDVKMYRIYVTKK